MSVEVEADIPERKVEQEINSSEAQAYKAKKALEGKDYSIKDAKDIPDRFERVNVLLLRQLNHMEEEEIELLFEKLKGMEITELRVKGTSVDKDIAKKIIDLLTKRYVFIGSVFKDVSILPPKQFELFHFIRCPIPIQKANRYKKFLEKSGIDIKRIDFQFIPREESDSDD